MHAVFGALCSSLLADRMRRPNTAQIERATRMLVHECGPGDGSAIEHAAAAGRILDKIVAQLSPLIGSSGVKALLARTATVANGAFSLAVDIDDSTSFQGSLLRQSPTVAGDAAALLFATFFALLEALIGERMTIEILRVWPLAEAPKEIDP